ncbi:acyl carrier protein [Streptomyces sp. JNUCC 64]
MSHRPDENATATVTAAAATAAAVTEAEAVAEDGTGNGTGERIARFLSGALRHPVGPDDDYFALGLVDSLFALELVTHVEHHYGFTVEVEDLELDNFRTVRRLTAFVLRKTGAGTPAAEVPAAARADDR